MNLIKKLLCRLFGHKWQVMWPITDWPPKKTFTLCLRCLKKDPDNIGNGYYCGIDWANGPDSHLVKIIGGEENENW